MRTTTSAARAARALVGLAVAVALLGALATGLVELAATSDCISAPDPGAPGPAPCGETFSRIRLGLLVQVLLAAAGAIADRRGRASIHLGLVLVVLSLAVTALGTVRP